MPELQKATVAVLSPTSDGTREMAKGTVPVVNPSTTTSELGKATVAIVNPVSDS